MKRKLAVLLTYIMILSGITPVNTYAWENRVYTDEEVTDAAHSGYVEAMFLSELGPQAGAFLKEVHSYLQSQKRPPIDAYNLDTYKTFYKQIVDLSLDFLEWKDYSMFDEKPNTIIGQDTVFMNLVNEQKANIEIFMWVIGAYQTVLVGNEFTVEKRTGTYPDGVKHMYFYVKPRTEDKNSPFYCNIAVSQIEQKGWFSDIYRYAQTRDEKYLFCNTFFPDIVDQEQYTEDGMITYQGFVELKRDQERKAAENCAETIRRGEAMQAGAYKTVYINWEGENHRKRRTSLKWYDDDSLNDGERNMLLANYMEGEYQKFLDALAEIPQGGSIEFQENKIHVDGKPLLQRELIRIN